MSNINGTTFIDIANIELKTQNIDLATTSSGNTNFLGVLEVNGVPVAAGGITNPLTADLNFNNFDATNVTDLNTKPVAQIVRNIVGAVSSNNIPIYDDTTGLELKDSGVNVNKINSAQNQLDSLAPAGLRDTWQIPSGLAFNGAFIQHFAGPDIMYAGGGFGGVLYYSLNGGITFAPVVFDVPLNVGYGPQVGYNGVGLFSIITGDVKDTSYTSVDGINFVSSGVILGAIPYSWQTLWVARLGLWVASIAYDATHGIGTSTDGITWMPQVLPWDVTNDFNFNTLIDTGDLLVLIGTGAAWSVDGINWTASTGITGYYQVGCYSPDRKELIATSNQVDATLLRSDDGKSWVSLGQKGRQAVVSIIWVGGDIQQYYLNNPNIPSYGGGVANVYSIYSCANPLTSAFESTYMVGADTQDMAYSAVIYDASRERFVIGLTSVGVAYSTSRPLIPKAMHDGTSYICMVTPTSLAGAQAAANLLTGLVPSSRLTIPSNSLTLGDVYRLEFSAEGEATNVGDSCTLDFSTVAAGLIVSIPIIAPVGGFPAGTPFRGYIDLIVASTSLVNTQTEIGGYIGAIPAFAGYSFGAQGIPFNSLIDQVITFTYTTANFISFKPTRILFYRVCSGTQ
jgi:hypothetical protein